MNIRLQLLVALSVALYTSSSAAQQSLSVTSLKCEEQVEPIGIGQATPVFSWQLNSPRRGVMQSAYQMLVATAPDLLTPQTADLWNSDKVSSDQSAYITYAGKPLQSSHRYYWKVRVWDEGDTASDWSPAASFVTGLLSARIGAPSGS